jgi:hypothetical protein
VRIPSPLENRKLLFQLDFIVAGAIGVVMWVQGAPSWAITLLVFVATRPSRFEMGPALSAELEDLLVKKPEEVEE